MGRCRKIQHLPRNADPAVAGLDPRVPPGVLCINIPAVLRSSVTFSVNGDLGLSWPESDYFWPPPVRWLCLEQNRGSSHPVSVSLTQARPPLAPDPSGFMANAPTVCWFWLSSQICF